MAIEKNRDSGDLRVLGTDRRSFLRSMATAGGVVAAGAGTLAGAAAAQPPRRPGRGRPRRPPRPPGPPVRPPGEPRDALSLVGDVPEVQVIAKVGTVAPKPPKLKRQSKTKNRLSDLEFYHLIMDQP